MSNERSNKMDCDTFKENERKILIHLLSQLDKRIYLLRVSMYGGADKYFSDEIPITSKILKMEDEDFRKTYNLSADDYRLIVDSCEIETCIRRILNEISTEHSCESLKAIIQELVEESTSFKRNQETIQDTRKQIDQLREVLPVIQEQAAGCLKSKQLDGNERSTKKEDSFGQTEFLKKLMEYKVESKKNFYEHQKAELQRSIEWYDRETRMQEHADIQTVSFWLLKFDDYTEKLDLLLKQMFDTWAAKRRELDIVSKYRKLNLEKIEKLQKLISEKEDYIEKYRKEKEKEQQQRERELKRLNAAIKIQAIWRGTMVRKQLGPFKVKKPKKGKKGKGKEKGKGKKKK